MLLQYSGAPLSVEPTVIEKMELRLSRSIHEAMVSYPAARGIILITVTDKKTLTPDMVRKLSALKRK
jgi:CTP:molybdopterin cytidylyltransferase MocA